MTGRVKRTFYVSCTDEEWEQAKQRAADAGMKTSPYLVERALTADLSRFGIKPEPLVLSVKDQSLLSSQLDWLIQIIPSSPAWLETLANQVAFLRDVKVTELISEGRYDELFLAYEKLFGSEKAEILLAKAVKEWHGAKQVDVTVTVKGPTRRM